MYVYYKDTQVKYLPLLLLFYAGIYKHMYDYNALSYLAYELL